MKPSTVALAAAACGAAVGGGLFLLALLPLLGVAWAVADWLWLLVWPVLWWKNRGKARKFTPRELTLPPLHLDDDVNRERRRYGL